MDNRYIYNVITNKESTKIYNILKNYATMETSVRLTGRTKDGYKIPGKNIKITKLYKDRNCLDYLMDTLGGLTQKEVNQVRERLLNEDAHRQVIEEGFVEELMMQGLLMTNGNSKPS